MNALSYTANYQQRSHFIYGLFWFIAIFALLGGVFRLCQGRYIELGLCVVLFVCMASLIYVFHRQPLERLVALSLIFTYGDLSVYCYMGSSAVALWMLTLPVFCFPTLKKEHVLAVDAVGLLVLLTAFYKDHWYGSGFYSGEFSLNILGAYLILSFACFFFHHIVVKYRSELAATIAEKRQLELTQTLSSGLAHLVNNQMSVVLGNVSLAETSNYRSKALQNIKKSAYQTSKHANDLLAYAQKAVVQHYHDDIHIASCFKDALEDMQIAASITVHLNEHEPLCIQGNKQQIEESVFKHMLMNAMESEPKSSVSIDIHKEELQADEELAAGSYAHIQIWDDGMGMDEETLRKVCDPFFSTKFLGRGMGLAAASGAVKNHHGRMHFESVQGEGSCCHLFLPMQQPEAKPA